MNRLKNTWILILILFAAIPIKTQNILQSLEGLAAFTSEAPLEVIQAESTQLKGALEKSSKTFAFTVEMKSFEGFNSPLQQVHFNENYMESRKYPMATFRGKIIEDINFDSPGEYKIRAKGKLTIHGVEHERIIRSNIEIDHNGSLLISSEFSIQLKDHKIRIPKIVYQKIAEIIKVQVRLKLDPIKS